MPLPYGEAPRNNRLLSGGRGNVFVQNIKVFRRWKEDLISFAQCRMIIIYTK